MVSNDPARIAGQLQGWIADKLQGRLERLDPSVCRGLSREEQYQKLEHLFGDILRGGQGNAASQPAMADVHFPDRLPSTNRSR